MQVTDQTTMQLIEEYAQLTDPYGPRKAEIYDELDLRANAGDNEARLWFL